MILFAFLPPLWAAAVGFGAIAIPVVIHLINRKRFKIVPWAAMKFLLAAQKQTRKRMRIEQLVLLLCRMMILGLIAFAMASVMPWAEDIWAAIGLPELGRGRALVTERTHHIFVLDSSLSMNQKVDGDQTAFEIARQLMKRKIDNGNSGDGYSVLLLKESPQWLIGEASQDARKVQREIDNIKPSHGNASVPAALNLVSSKLSEIGPRFPRQAVYFFTDMQNSTWAGPGELKGDKEGKEKAAFLEIEEKKATTVFVDCGPLRDSANLAVSQVAFDLERTPYLTTGMDFTLKATVRNFGAEPKTVRPELLIGQAKDRGGDAPLEMRVNASRVDPESIPARSELTFLFKDVRFDKAGTYAVQVRLPDDVLAPDNTRTIILTVRDTIPVLLVNGKLSAERFGLATDFLQIALNPFAPGKEERWAPLRPTVRNPIEFKDMTDAALEAFDCIFWCDVPDLGVTDLKRLDTHVRRGGGLIVSLGDKAADKLGDYNEKFYKGGQGLLPAKLLKHVKATAEHSFYLRTLDANAYTQPPLEAFRDTRDQLTLQRARFREYVQAEVKEGRARTVLDFATEYNVNDKGIERDNNLPVSAPAIIEWNPPLSRAQQWTDHKPGKRIDKAAARYRGKVILLTSTVNRDWSNWPGSPSYVAMMHELTRLAISGRLREQSTTVGGLLDAYLAGGAEVDVVLKYPADSGVKPKNAKTQGSDDVNVFRWADTDFAGIYRLDTPEGLEIPFAVNVPTSSGEGRGSESDLARVEENKLKEGYPGWNFQLVRDPVRAMLSGTPINLDAIDVPQPVGPFLANVALLIVLGLLFLEIVLAWHFGHYTTMEGAIAQAAPSPTVTAIAAVIAVLSVIVVGIGAYVIIDENYNGDFLGFLPDIVRAWFEFAMNIEEPTAGEGRNWPLEKASYLFGIPGPEHWYAVLLTLGAAVAIFFTYKAEAPRVPLLFKLLLGLLRFCLILTTLWFLLPRPQIKYERKGFPDLVILIDDTRSMGEADSFQDEAVKERVEVLKASIRDKLRDEIPAKIAAMNAELTAKKAAAENDPDLNFDVKSLEERLKYWRDQDDNLKDPNKWRPSRLQLVQAILAQDKPHWLKTLLQKKETKIHIFHLDADGRATKLRDVKGDAGDIISSQQIDRASKAIDKLGPLGNDSRLGTAVRQVIDHYRGSALSSVIMFTDGVTTRDETLSQAADYAAQRGVSLFFVGVGDEHEARDLKLHDLNVDDPIYKGDTAVFEVRLTGHGFKDLTVPVRLKLEDKDKVFRDVDKTEVKVDQAGKTIKLRLKHKPKDVGPHKYSIEVDQPKLQPNEKPLPQESLKIVRTIEVVDMKQIKVLLVEGQPRYEFRYLKFLLEREAVQKNNKDEPKDQKEKRKGIELKVLLLEAEDDWHKTDTTALANFPPMLDGKDGLNEYDVVILGDCDPGHEKLRNNLKNIAAYVKGEDEKGKKGKKNGGGLLFLAGSVYNPHRYKGTPLADVMPVEPTQDVPPPEVAITSSWRPTLTPAGKSHPMFRFGPDEGENQKIWSNLAKMYWHSSKYRIKPLAEVLAVHPHLDAQLPLEPGQDPKFPLIVQQYVGTGRSMFFGVDETWRWRLREDEAKFSNFWIHTMRYLSRGRSTRTDLRLDRQTPYKTGENIKVTVRFQDNAPSAGDGPPGTKGEEKKVEINITHVPPTGKGETKTEFNKPLTKVEGSFGTWEYTIEKAREGKYRVVLAKPDVAKKQPDLQQPSAEGIVEAPPGELDRLRMDYQEMNKAAQATNGGFYTLANCDKLLEELPPGWRPSHSANVPPTLLWNQWWVFALIVLLITSEWVLRKMKHLL